MLSPVRWRYPEIAGIRDERLDFLRGFAMMFVIMYHVGGISAFYLLAMFGLEVVLGGEVFVAISGVSLARAQRQRIARDGWGAASRHLLRRGTQLYALYVIVALSAWMLSKLPLPAADALTTFTDSFSGGKWSMYGSAGDFVDVLLGVLLLRYGPWQYGIVAMFVLLAAATPLATRLLIRGSWWILLVVSWTLFTIGVTWQLHPFPTVFGGGAPLLTWQLAFAHGLVIGYHRDAIHAFMYGRGGRWLIALGFGVGLALVLFSLNAPFVYDVLWRRLPEWASLQVIPAERYEPLRQMIFGSREWPHVGRVLSIFAAAIVFLTALTLYWVPIKRLIGWLTIPLGRRSLLVFTVQAYLVFVLAQIDVVRRDTPGTNTLVQIATILVLWLIARAWPRTRVAGGDRGDEARGVAAPNDALVPSPARAPTRVL